MTMLNTERALQLQLEVSQTLTQHTSRDDIGLALAEVMDQVVPFEFFLHSIWNPQASVGYRISSRKNANGKFEAIHDVELLRLREENFAAFVATGEFLRHSDNAGIYDGERFKALSEKFPAFGVAYNHHGIRSMMLMNMVHTNGFIHVMVISDRAEHAFTQSQYMTISTVVPQIKLGFENLFKYEKLMQEERERNVQLGIMTAFNARRDLDEMALQAISSITELIPFEFWFNVSRIPRGKGKDFRVACKVDGKLIAVDSDDLFARLQMERSPAETFMQQHAEVFSRPRLFVGADLDQLLEQFPFFAACHEHLGINSIATIPLATLGEVNTYMMMASTRKFAFNDEDLAALTRTLPYIGMAAQQYYSLFQIQSLSRQLEMEKDYLVEEIKHTYNFDEIIGSNHLMKSVFKKIAQVAPADTTVLVLGETGTGKELIARAIHNQSPRKSKVLVKVNCASLPSQLIESELFGHEKGSFTGAVERRIGKFELANEGTIFLDEIGELPLELQAKLLRVLQEREIERIGGKTTIPLDVRIIAATNRDLETEVTEGRFRSDLYYRLSVFPIQLPALRERKDDIPMLITHFVQKFCAKMKRPFLNLRKELLQQLVAYDWPGNIRELENVIEQQVIVGHDDHGITAKLVSKKPKPVIDEKATAHSADEEIFMTLKRTRGKVLGPEGAARLLNLRPSEVEVYERKWILDALRKADGRVRGDKGAASLLEINPTTLEARMKKLRITKAEIFG